jgi:hypothetical protein
MLDGIEHSLKLFFHESWWEKYVTTPDSEIAAISPPSINLTNFDAELNILNVNILNILIRSVLEGEYVHKIRSTSALSACKISLEKITEELTLLNDYSNGDEIFNLLKGFKDHISIVFSHYMDLSAIIDKQLNFDTRMFFSPLESAEEKIEVSPFGDLKISAYFQLVLRVAKLDHNHGADGTSFSALEECLQECRKYIPDDDFVTAKALREKIVYLLSKWVQRKILSSPEDESHYIVSFSGEEAILTRDVYTSNIYNANRPINSWIHEMKHEDWKEKLKADFKAYERAENSESDIVTKRYHCQTKYFKEISNSTKELDTLNQELKLFLDQKKATLSSFDRYALILLRSYIFNSRFSLLLKKTNEDINESSLKKIDEEYHTICRFQTVHGFFNYFVHKSYSSFIIHHLKKFYDSRKVMDKLNQSSILLKYGAISFEKYKMAVRWSKQNLPYACQYQFEDCVFEYKNLSNDTLNLFICSSHFLPLNYDVVEQDYHNIKLEYDKLKTVIEVFDNIKFDREALSSATYRNLEVIGVFSSIITFVLSSVTAFKFVNDAIGAFYFMMSLGLSLSFFVLTLIIAFRGRDFLKRNVYFLLIMGSLALIVWLFFIYTQTHEAPLKINFWVPILFPKMGS